MKRGFSSSKSCGNISGCIRLRSSVVVLFSQTSLLAGFLALIPLPAAARACVCVCFVLCAEDKCLVRVVLVKSTRTAAATWPVNHKF